MKKIISGSLFFLLTLSSLHASDVVSQKFYATTAGIFSEQVTQDKILKDSYLERTLNINNGSVSYSYCKAIDTSDSKYECKSIAQNIPMGELLDVHSEYVADQKIDTMKLIASFLVGTALGVKFFPKSIIGIIASAAIGVAVPVIMDKDSGLPYVNDYLEIDSFKYGKQDIYLKSNNSDKEDQVDTISDIAYSLSHALEKAKKDGTLNNNVLVNYVTELSE